MFEGTIKFLLVTTGILFLIGAFVAPDDGDDGPRNNPFTLSYKNQASEPLDVWVVAPGGFGEFRMDPKDGCIITCPKVKCVGGPVEVGISLWTIDKRLVNEGTYSNVECGEIYRLHVTAGGSMEFHVL